jgi:hypothetical protein
MANQTTAQKIQNAEKQAQLQPLPQPKPQPQGPAKISLPAKNYAFAEVKTRDWDAIIPKDTPIEQILVPEYWSARAPLFSAGSFIRCRWEDNSRLATLWVMAAGSSWVAVELLHDHIRKAAEPVPPSAHYKIDFVASGWRVISRETGRVLQGEFAKQEDAEAFLDAELKKR